MGAFNILSSYQTVGRSLEPHQNPYSWALRRYKKALKPKSRPPTAKNHKAIYMHFKQLQTRYRDTPKIPHSYTDTLCYFQKAFLYWLWHRRRCGRHHIGDYLEGAILLYSRGPRWRPSSIWTHSQGLAILTSSLSSIKFIRIMMYTLRSFNIREIDVK